MAENNGFGYFLLGLGIGVATGVILAPKSGSETREFIRSKAGESGEFLRNRAGDSREFIRRRSGEIRSTAGDLVEKGRSVVKNRKDNLSAAVEAGKQAYRDAVSSFDTGAGEGV